MDARNFAPPTSISAVAAEQLAATLALDIAEQAPPDDVAGWNQVISFANEMLAAMIPEPASGIRPESTTLGGVPVFEARFADRSDGQVCLFLHGGGFTIGTGEVCRAMTAGFAEGIGIHTIGVDYRMPPDHPYPTPLDDCLAAYRALLQVRDPAEVVVAGGSAGANLAAALVLRARDEGLAMPSAVVLLSPEADLTESGDSFSTLRDVDPVLRSSLAPMIELYAAGHDLTDPYLSPLFGDFTTGFPRTFLQCGTRDLFLSNTVRFHRALRRCAIPAELHVFEAMPHGGFASILRGGLGEAPEDQEVYAELRRFLAATTST